MNQKSNFYLTFEIILCKNIILFSLLDFYFYNLLKIESSILGTLFLSNPEENKL